MSKVWFITGTGSGIGQRCRRLKSAIALSHGRNVQKLRNALRGVTIAALLAGSCAAYGTGDSDPGCHERRQDHRPVQGW